jgi:hypothetical protein
MHLSRSRGVEQSVLFAVKPGLVEGLNDLADRRVLLFGLRREGVEVNDEHKRFYADTFLESDEPTMIAARMKSLLQSRRRSSESTPDSTPELV